METISPVNLPLLERSGYDRVITYGIYHYKEGQYILKKFFSTRARSHVYQDFESDCICNDVEWLHHFLLQQGLVPFLPSAGDDPKLIMSYV